MSYQPYDRQPSGIVFFGSAASDQVYESVNNFIYNSGTDTLLTPNLTASSTVAANNIVITDGSTIGSSSVNNAITIGGDGAVSIFGDLTVNGTTTTVNSTTLTVEDPIIVLGSGAPTADDNKDRGVSFNYYDGAAKTGFFGFDDSTGKFTFIPDATIADEVVVSGSFGIVVADLEGNASTSTTLENARYIGVSDQVTGSGTFNGDSDLIFNVQLTADAINDQTETNTANTDDYIIVSSGTSLRKISKSNFVSDLGGGTMSSFILEDSAGVEVSITNDKEVKFIGISGVGINWTDTSNGTDEDPYDLTFTVDHDQTFNFVANEHIDHSTVNVIAGSGLLGGGTIDSSLTLDVVGGDGITSLGDEIKVTIDDSTINFTSTDGNGAIQVKDAGITEAKRSRTIETVTSNQTNSYAYKDVTLIDASSNNVTLTIPSSTSAGRLMIFKRIDQSANNVIIQRNGTDTIDGSVSFQLYHKYETVTVISDGGTPTKWYIV